MSCKRDKTELKNVTENINRLIFYLSNAKNKMMGYCSTHFRLDTSINVIIEDGERFVELYSDFVGSMKSSKLFGNIQSIKNKQSYILECRRYSILQKNLCKNKLQYLRALSKTIIILVHFADPLDMFLKQILNLAHLMNKIIKIKDGNEFNIGSICRNTHPSLLSRSKPFDFNGIIDILSQKLTEMHAMFLVHNLLSLYTQGNSSCKSSSSSIDILETLTLEMSPVTNVTIINNRAKEENDERHKECEQMYSFNQRLGKLVIWPEELGTTFHRADETAVNNILSNYANLYGSCFAQHHEEKNMKEMAIDLVRNTLRYTQTVLEHIMLWWNDIPLTAFCINEIDLFRRWMYSKESDGIESSFRSIKTGLSHLLTAFVCNVIWDHEFRLCIILDNNSKSIECTKFQPNPECNEWEKLFSTLYNLNDSLHSDNSEDKTTALPLSEQIILMHRIDHSVHSMRLWTREKAKILCQDWNMPLFFSVINNFIEPCLIKMNCLKFTPVAAWDISNTYVGVCIALRIKLISEINVNIQQTKITSVECIQILSSFCRTSCMALLLLCFPCESYWKTCSIADSTNEYVFRILNEIYLPVLKASNDIEILDLVLKIICESWLDYIFAKQIRFSVNGAINLLNDFKSIDKWIEQYSNTSSVYMEHLLQHESLRMCIGVGKILLRKPDDIVNILKTPLRNSKRENASSDDTALLPPEMFVPNQENWLRLRGENSDKFIFIKELFK